MKINMSYQLRHKDNGLYQGSFLGLGFWYPMSNQPEQGICEFTMKADIQGYIDFLISVECSSPLKRDDLTIENFDVDLNKELIESGKKF